MPASDAHVMAIWKQVYERFDPVKPGDGEVHVPRDRYNPIAGEVAERLLLPLDHQKIILAGGRGSGKSTELLAVGSQLAEHKDVILFDLHAHFVGAVRDTAALERVQAHELVGILGLAVLRAGSDRLGVVEWGGHDKRFAAALSALQPSATSEAPMLDVAKLVKGVSVTVGSLTGGAVVAGGLVLLENLADSFDWRVGLPDQRIKIDQEAPIQALLTATNALLDHVRGFCERDLVIILDGLDRVRSEETFVQLVVGSSLLSQLRADLVVTFDLGLVERHRNSLQAWSILDFTYVPVVTRDGLAPDERGVTFLGDVVRRRLDLIHQPDLLRDGQIARLAFDSAGSVRDLVRLVREVAVQCMIRKIAVADDAAIDKVLDRHRREQEGGLHTGHIRVLRGLLADPERRLPEDPLVVYLLNRQLILAYPNRSTWFLPHTALIEETLMRAGATS
jgi:hypothetical protein